MRRIAQEMGVGAMTLYYYVATKNELIAAMDDALLAGALLPKLSSDWRKAIVAIAQKTREIFLRHPWALIAMLNTSPGINALRHMEQCLEALAPLPITDKKKFALLATIDDFVFGYALREGSASAPVDMEFAAAQIASGAFPRLARALANGPLPPARDRFERGLRALLDAAVLDAVPRPRG